MPSDIFYKHFWPFHCLNIYSALWLEQKKIPTKFRVHVSVHFVKSARLHTGFCGLAPHQGLTKKKILSGIYQRMWAWITCGVPGKNQGCACAYATWRALKKKKLPSARERTPRDEHPASYNFPSSTQCPAFVTWSLDCWSNRQFTYARTGSRQLQTARAADADFSELSSRLFRARATRSTLLNV